MTVVARLPLIPGPMLTRAWLAATCVLPKIRWVAPFIRPPPRSLDNALMRCMTRSTSNPWCVARCCANDICGSPTYATAFQALRSARCWVPYTASGHLIALDAHARLLGLRVLEITQTAVWAAPHVGVDPRVFLAAASAMAADDGIPVCFGPFG